MLVKGQLPFRSCWWLTRFCISEGEEVRLCDGRARVVAARGEERKRVGRRMMAREMG